MLIPIMIVVLLVVLPFICAAIESGIRQQPINPKSIKIASFSITSCFIVAIACYYGTLYLMQVS
jgi:hypothetical protein